MNIAKSLVDRWQCEKEGGAFADLGLKILGFNDASTDRQRGGHHR
ncbi:hypothetical protein [Acaryochloris sp. IP29b_bin.137]|nr:hypothetical protein [Acaryochloris sp. IP29b_bin.137]